MNIPLFLMNIFHDIELVEGRAYIVGGAVRDHLLELPNKDFDVEVHGVSIETLFTVLEQYGQINQVGKSFGVLLLRRGGQTTEFALPRRENKEGRGHKGFLVELDPTMTLGDAARRRDFTINSMYFDPLNGILYDPFDGEADLTMGSLHRTSDAYQEDPLRVLRGFQFISRFNLTPTTDTVYDSIDMVFEYDTLSKERIWEEWRKWAKGAFLSKGLSWLMTTGWMVKYPEIINMVGIRQDPEWHPEGDCYTHTLHAVDAAAQLADGVDLGEERRAILIFAALCHDMGKVSTTKLSLRSGRIIAKGHAEVSAGVAKTFLMRIGAPNWLINQVIPLVREHMFFRHGPTKKSVRRLANRLAPASVNMLTLLVQADMLGRPPRKIPTEVLDGLLETLNISEELKILDSAPKPILMGRHLLAFIKPGPEIGRILKGAFEAQLDGEFDELNGALAWARRRLENV